MKCLSIDKFFYGFKETNVIELLRLNPNLKMLNLNEFDSNIIQEASKYIQNVENFKLSYLRGNGNNIELSSIQLKNVKKNLK